MMSPRSEITHVPRNTFRVIAQNMKRSPFLPFPGALNLWKGINSRDIAQSGESREKPQSFYRFKWALDCAFIDAMDTPR